MINKKLLSIIALLSSMNAVAASATTPSLLDFGMLNHWHNRLWLKSEALLWWIKPAPVSAPLLSTFVPGSPSASTGFGGILGVDGTIVLSPKKLDYHELIGNRTAIGMWLDDCQRVGIEANAFLLRTATSNSATFADSTGSPPLRALFVNPPPGGGFPLGESSFVLSDPGFATGGQSLASMSRLWGTELNGFLQVWNTPSSRLYLLGGFRNLYLSEQLTITDIETVALVFGTFKATDNFNTRNQFYGGQLGLKAESRYQQFFGSVEAKVALGGNHERVSLNGNSAQSVGSPPTTEGGIYIQKSNIGTHVKDKFAVAPALNLQAGMDLTPNVSISFGYDLIYLNNVVRPGDQIDRTINVTQNAIILPPGTLSGAARPSPRFVTTDFWAQGINAGIEVKW